MEIGTWLRSLGLGDSTALAARLDAGGSAPWRRRPAGRHLRRDRCERSTAGGVVDGVPAKPAVPEAAMVR